MRRTVRTVIAAAALAVAAAACGSATSSSSSGAATSGPATPGASQAAPSASPTRLTGTAATDLVSRAVANTKAATSLRARGQAVTKSTGDQQVTSDIALVKGQGCSGTISIANGQQFQVVVKGGYIWVKPNSTFYESHHLSKQALDLLKNKYIKVKSTDTRFSDLIGICSSTGLLGQLNTPTGTPYVATATTYQGQPAYRVTPQGKSGEIIISRTSAPLLLKLISPQTPAATVAFSDYNAVKEITPPPANQTIDGSQLGL